MKWYEVSFAVKYRGMYFPSITLDAMPEGMALPLARTFNRYHGGKQVAIVREVRPHDAAL